jgi:hypothetical protein
MAVATACMCLHVLHVHAVCMQTIHCCTNLAFNAAGLPKILATKQPDQKILGVRFLVSYSCFSVFAFCQNFWPTKRGLTQLTTDKSHTFLTVV